MNASNLRLAVVTVLACSLGLTAAPSRAGYIDHFSVPDDIGRAKVPHTGAPDVLVLRLEVGSVPSWTSTETFFSAAAPDGFEAYWAQSSFGAYTPRVTLADPIHYDTCPLPPPHDDCVISRGDVTVLVPAIVMLADVLARADQELGLDFTQFDGNGDGWIDGVELVADIDVAGIALPVVELAGLAGLPPDAFTFDGVQINAVAISERGSFSTYLHEWGHLLGFDDMYNEDGLDIEDPAQGLEPNPGSAHSLMGSGITRYTMLNAVDRVKIGWATVVDVTTERVAEVIPPVAETGVVYRIGSGNEYFLVENRRPPQGGDSWAPFDSSIPGAGGLAIFRVTESKAPKPDLNIILRLLECPNCNEFKPFIFFEQADGLFEYQSEAGYGNRNDPADFFATGDSFVSRPDDVAPISRSHLVLRSNFLSGPVTGAEVVDIDADSAYPNVIATLRPYQPFACGTVATSGAGAARVALLALALALLPTRRRLTPRR